MGRRVTSQSDMKVTPQRQTYMRSSLKQSCYVDKRSVEEWATPILNPLALTYHFGQASVTPERKRAAKSTKHSPHPPGSNHVVNKKGWKFHKQVFGMVATLTIGNRKGTLGHWKRHQRQVGDKAEAQLNIFFLKIPKTSGSPGFFFAREDEIRSQGEDQKKNPAWTGAS